jgi:F-type H+-transporting ATPase subunit delta
MYEYLDRRYALALYQVGEKNNKVEDYIRELKEIVYLIKNNVELLSIVEHPEITTSKKKCVFEAIFKDQIDEHLLSFLLILIEKERIPYLEEKLRELEKIHLEKQNMVEATVKTVIPLNEEEKASLIKKLETQYEKTILLKEEIDKSLIGGVYVRVGNDVIDGTVKAEFDEIKKKVLGR